MSALASGLYVGAVTHTRVTPRRHRLRYSMFQILFDLDELAAMDRRFRFFSRNRFNLLGFHDKDHGDGRAGSLRGYMEETLAGAGISVAGGRIELLCMPRLLGHVFNPLSVYFCWTADGALAAMLYEVNNTFGERHSYLIPGAPTVPGQDIQQSCDKAFHVSPFMDMALRYSFRVSQPGETIATAIDVSDRAGAPILAAAFRGRRRELSDAALLGAFFGYPLLTLKVVAAIHWEAGKLLFKGVRLRPRPPAPPSPVTVVS